MKEKHSNCEDQKRNRWWSPRTTQKGNFFAAAERTPTPLQFPFPANDPWQEISVDLSGAGG